MNLRKNLNFFNPTKMASNYLNEKGFGGIKGSKIATF